MTPRMDWLPMIERIARGAGEILLAHKDKGFSVSTKSNPKDMVTEADIEADALIRRELAKAFPGDKILSEEEETVPSMSGRVWIVDPLDGTDCFVRGDTGFAVLIGLCVDGTPLLGAAYIPCLDELYFAEKGKGAFLTKDGKLVRISVSKTEVIENSHGLFHPNETRSADVSISGRIPAKWLVRSSGAMDQMRVARGDADFFININRASKWDVCATQVIIEESGGRITTLDNEPILYSTPGTKLLRSYFVSNGKLHQRLYEDYLKNKC